ncbi:MAG: hypothetical protein IT431_07180 [Phycisphaerales bacterium]|nr:hypothetical protein [Phycisphaerales bacterium]
MLSDQSKQPAPSSDDALEPIGAELAKRSTSRARRIAEKFVVAALGSIPWVGGFVAAAAELRRDEAASESDDLRTQWLHEHARKLAELEATMEAVVSRFESFGSRVDERIQSPGYLSVVRQAFRAWDRSETDDKRQLIANLVANAAGTRVCSDDVVRLFVEWVDSFHEAHFAIVREVHHNPGSTRFEIWQAIYGELPREDSAEADLFRLLIRDLSTQGVIRQARDTTERGEFLRHRPPARRAPTPATMKSSFDDTDPYVLTDLGRQLVHYTLMGDVRRLEKADGQVHQR